MRRISLIIISLVFVSWAIIALILIQASHQNTKNDKNPKPTPCVSTNYPCIKVTQQDGTVYRLNDFRFVSLNVDPRHCILFISLPDEAHHETCGNYQLKWIGPGVNTKA